MEGEKPTDSCKEEATGEEAAEEGAERDRVGELERRGEPATTAPEEAAGGAAVLLAPLPADATPAPSPAPPLAVPALLQSAPLEALRRRMRSSCRPPLSADT